MRSWSEHSETVLCYESEASATSEAAHQTPPESAQPERKSTQSYGEESIFNVIYSMCEENEE